MRIAIPWRASSLLAGRSESQPAPRAEHFRHRLLVGAFACLLATPGGLAAEIFELPAEIALEGSTLTFDLADADLAIEVRPGDPFLSARVARKDGGSAHLETSGGEGDLRISRPMVDGEVPRLLIEAAIAPGQRLRLIGRRLTLVIDDPPPEEPTDPTAPMRPQFGGDPANARASFQLSLEDSEADLTGLQSPVLDLTSAAVWLSGTRGNLGLTLRGGSVQIRSHRGDLKLDAAGAEVAVDDHRGLLAPQLEGGSLDVTGGRGNFNGSAANAALRLDGWSGQVELKATDSTLEGRASGSARAPWKIVGIGLQLVLDGVQSAVTATLDGGSFEGSSLRSQIVVVAKKGTRLDLTQLKAPLLLTLTGVEARLSGAETLKAELTNSQLEVDGVRQLTLTATGSQVTAREVGQLIKLEVTSSELDLDLKASGKPAIKLLGRSRATVRLTIPCLLQLTGPAAMVDRQVRLTGCDLLAPGQRLHKKQKLFRYGSHPMTILSAQVSKGSELEIEGR